MIRPLWKKSDSTFLRKRGFTDCLFALTTTKIETTKKLVEIIVKKFNSVQIFLVLFNETSRTENEYNCKKTLLKIFARLILVDLSVLELRLPLLLERDDDERHEDVDEEEREHDEEDDVEDRHLRPGTFSKYALLLLNKFHHLALEEGKGFIVTPNM